MWNEQEEILLGMMRSHLMMASITKGSVKITNIKAARQCYELSKEYKNVRYIGPEISEDDDKTLTLVIAA